MRLTRTSLHSLPHRTPSLPARPFQQRGQGVDTWLTSAGRIPESTVLKNLGSRVVELKAKRVPARVLWVNFELARELGFKLPPTNRLTPELERQLLDAVAYRAVKKGETPDGDPNMRLYADLYGGSGMGANIGAARAALLPFGNLYAKGFPTGLRRPSPKADFQHTSDAVSMEEVCYEAIWGKVYPELTTRSSSQVLLVLDPGAHTKWPDGSLERQAIAIRVDGDCRPGHLVKQGGKGEKFSAEIFEKAARDAGDLQFRIDANGQRVPDFDATLDVQLDAHAKTVAEQERYRLLHGAISTSNITFSGAQIDLATSTAQPRSAPINLKESFHRFGEEHLGRLKELVSSYRRMVDGMSPADRKRFNASEIKTSYSPLAVHASNRMVASYRRELNLQFAKAAGLKDGLVDQLARTHPQEVAAFGRAVSTLAALCNPGPLNADKKVVSEASAADVFNFLRFFPPHYFENPARDHTQKAMELLDFQPREQWESKPEVAEAVKALLESYRRLMTSASTHQAEHYSGPAQMQRSISARAQFENQPLDALYRSELKQRIQKAVSDYERGGDPRVIKELIDTTVSSSHRSVDALLLQGRMRRMAGGMVELQRRAVDGVFYSVRARGDERWLRVSLQVRGNERDGYSLQGVPDSRTLYGSGLNELKYHYTLDGWKTARQQQGALAVNSRGEVRAVHFDVPLEPDRVTGSVEGLFTQPSQADAWFKDAGANFRGYHFAVPDRHELAALLARHDAVTQRQP